MECYSTFERKKILSHSAAWVSLEDIMLSEISQIRKTNTIGFQLCEEVQFDRREDGCQELGCDEANGELLLNGYRASVWEDEQVLEMDGADGYAIMGMYLMKLEYTLKMVKRVNFIIHIHNLLTHTHKKNSLAKVPNMITFSLPLSTVPAFKRLK